VNALPKHHKAEPTIKHLISSNIPKPS